VLDIRDKIVSEVERFRRAEMKKKGKHLRSCPDKRIAVNLYERKFEELRDDSEASRNISYLGSL